MVVDFPYLTTTDMEGLYYGCISLTDMEGLHYGVFLLLIVVALLLQHYKHIVMIVEKFVAKVKATPIPA